MRLAESELTGGDIDARGGHYPKFDYGAAAADGVCLVAQAIPSPQVTDTFVCPPSWIDTNAFVQASWWLFIDVRHRRDTASPPFGSWNAWIGLVVGASRYMGVVPLGGASLILCRSWQTLAIFMSQFCKLYTKIVAGGS